MKFFTNKNFKLKMIIVLVCLIIINFSMPTVSYGKGLGEMVFDAFCRINKTRRRCSSIYNAFILCSRSW